MDGRDAPLVFISYQDSEARQYALSAKSLIESKGFRAWVWHCDRKSAGYVLDEIMDAIEESSFFLYIATKSSEKSRGQGFERRYAWDQGRDPAFVLAFSEDYISREHRVEIWNIVTEATFAEVCEKVAAELPKYRLVETEVTVIQEGESL